MWSGGFGAEGHLAHWEKGKINPVGFYCRNPPRAVSKEEVHWK